MPTPSPLPLVAQVVDNDMCIACGACLPACPFENISPAFSKVRGAFEVKILSTEKCSGCDQPCSMVCPSIKVDFIKSKAGLSRSDSDDSKPARDGWIQSVHLGWSKKYRDDEASSSGGVIRLMIADALAIGMPVICLARDPADGEYKPRLLTKISDVQYIPGSIYHSTSFIGAIDLIRQAQEPVMLVAIPCQLSGILQYIADFETALSKKIEIVCGIICGWMYSHQAIEAFCQFKKIRYPVEDASYRGGDRIGKLKIISEGHKFAYDRRNFSNATDALDFQASFSTDFNRLRCRVCEDHLNMSADIVTGDAWVQRKASEKISIIATRTPAGEKLLKKLADSEQVILEPASFNDLIESQSQNLIYGHVAKKMNRQLGNIGIVAPRYSFADSDSPTHITAIDRISFWSERARRWIVRKQWYRSYRALYFVRKKISSFSRLMVTKFSRS